MDEPERFLIVEARFYGDIADALVEGATQVFDAAGVAYDRLEVPGVFEIPAAIQFAAKANLTPSPSTKYSGYIALGCVIRGETDHYDHICRETSRSLMDLAVMGGAPLGFGIITCENSKQAWARASADKKNVGGSAAMACLRMNDIKKKYPHILK